MNQVKISGLKIKKGAPAWLPSFRHLAFESDILSHLTFIIPKVFFEQRKISGGKFFQGILFKLKRTTQQSGHLWPTIERYISLKYGNLVDTGVNEMSSRSVRSGKKMYRTTFTYFIPAPPQRKSGYREIEFDKIMRGILESGFEIESLETQGSPNGMFVLAVLKTNSKKVFETDSVQDLHEKFKLSNSHLSSDIILDEEEDV